MVGLSRPSSPLIEQSPHSLRLHYRWAACVWYVFLVGEAACCGRVQPDRPQTLVRRELIRLMLLLRVSRKQFRPRGYWIRPWWCIWVINHQWALHGTVLVQCQYMPVVFIRVHQNWLCFMDWNYLESWKHWLGTNEGEGACSANIKIWIIDPAETEVLTLSPAPLQIWEFAYMQNTVYTLWTKLSFIILLLKLDLKHFRFYIYHCKCLSSIS